MEVNNLLSTELPFLYLSDETFHSFLSVPTHTNAVIHKDFEFDPFKVDYCKYNQDLDVNEFYMCNRSTVVPKSEYIFLDNISYLKTNALTISNVNIRSIPKNLQCFREIILDISHINFTGPYPGGVGGVVRPPPLLLKGPNSHSQDENWGTFFIVPFLRNVEFPL